jgi:predicted O-methyltransferase YrrM
MKEGQDMIEENVIHYINKLNNPNEEWIHDIEQEAKEHNVPIMDKVGIAFLTQLIRMQKPSKVLEIGTAIGYSALRMASVHDAMKIVTIERDKNMFQRAKNNIEKQEKENQIVQLFGDALEVVEDVKAYGPFDLIFIDAAKGQYEKFFMRYEQMLSKNGIIITDNVLFRGYVATESAETKRLKKIAEKIDRYNQWLVNHPDYTTTIFPIGDGVAITVPKEIKEY